MTEEQVNKGKIILDDIEMWRNRLSAFENDKTPSSIRLERYSTTIRNDGVGSELNKPFIEKVNEMYYELCLKQIEQLEKELEAL